MIKLVVKRRILHDKENHYRILTNKTFYDGRLSPLSKILLMHLLGKHSKDYNFSIPQLAKVLSTSNSSIDRSVSELKKYGYLTSTSIGGKKNGIQSWWIFELPDYLLADTKYGVNKNLADTVLDALYKDIDYGGINATPQSTIEEKKEEQKNGFNNDN